jgi:hypothetical protein
MSRVKKQLESKGYAIRAFLDTEGASDSTSNIAIKEAMTRHEIPDVLVDWTENRLAGRNLTVHHMDITTEGTSDRGCPQGGVLFPLLRCLMVNNLLVHLQ